MGYVAGSPKDSFRSFIYTTDVDQLHFVLFTLSGRDTKSTIPASSCDSSHLYRFSVEDPVELLFPFRVKRFSSSHSFFSVTYICTVYAFLRIKIGVHTTLLGIEFQRMEYFFFLSCETPWELSRAIARRQHEAPRTNADG